MIFIVLFLSLQLNGIANKDIIDIREHRWIMGTIEQHFCEDVEIIA